MAINYEGLSTASLNSSNTQNLNQNSHLLQNPSQCLHIPSMLITNNLKQGFQYSHQGGPMFPHGGTSCLNMMNVLLDYSAMGVPSNGNFVPRQLSSQGPFVEQNRLLIGSSPGLTIAASPQYPNGLSTLNQGQLTTESFPGYANSLHLQAQRKPSVQQNSMILPFASNRLAFGVNFPCLPSAVQTEYSHSSYAQDRGCSDREGFSLANYAPLAPSISNVPRPSLQQQQRRCFERHRRFHEEKGQTEQVQEERRTPSNTVAFWGHIPSPIYQNECSNNKKSTSSKFIKHRLQKECIKLYGFEAPLHHAIQMNDMSSVRQLLKKTNPNIYHRETGETPLHLACRRGKLNMVKLLRRHPKININLRTIFGVKAVSSPGETAVQLAYHFGKFNVVNFLISLKPKNPIKSVQLSPLMHKLKTETEVIKRELDDLKPQIDIRTKENEELKQKLRELRLGDAVVMGKKLPRNIPNDKKKLAEALKRLRELESDLIATQERIWSEREDEKQCNICTAEEKNTVLVPCGHFFCSACAWKVKRCPNCRSSIERRVKTFK